MSKKIELYVFVIIGILIVALLGTSFAYLAISSNGSGDNIEGRTFDFDVSMGLDVIKRATNLVPLSNNLVGIAISKVNDKCIDSNGREVCSLYRVNFSNSGDNVHLAGYVITDNTTYITSNLKCQLFDSSFNSVSDVITLSNVNNGKVYLTSGGSNASVNLSSGNNIYYFVIWLSDTLGLQNDDYSKSFSGNITFEAGNMGRVSANFGV